MNTDVFLYYYEEHTVVQLLRYTQVRNNRCRETIAYLVWLNTKPIDK